MGSTHSLQVSLYQFQMNVDHVKFCLNSDQEGSNEDLKRSETDRRRRSLQGEKVRFSTTPTPDVTLASQRQRGQKVEGFGFDPAHPTVDTTRLSIQRERGRKVEGFGFDPANPTPGNHVMETARGRKVEGFGFDPAHPTPEVPVMQAIRGRPGRKVEGFGFDPAHPTPSVDVVNAPRRCRKVKGFGFDPAHPTVNPWDNQQERGRKVAEFGFDPAHPTPPSPSLGIRTVIPKWEAQSFHEAKQNGVCHTGIKVLASPGGASTLTLD